MFSKYTKPFKRFVVSSLGVVTVAVLLTGLMGAAILGVVTTGLVLMGLFVSSVLKQQHKLASTENTRRDKIF